VHLAGSAIQHFGWRPILRSTDVTAPISQYIGPNGIRIQSYDDAVSARTIYDHLMRGSLLGPEASTVTIRFDLGAGMNVTSTGVQQSDGVYSGFRATCYLNYESWLNDGDDALFHEYGHAWSQYYAYMVQQDGTFSSYIRARGLSGDLRLGTSYAWDINEIIAEDYRQLFGDDSARLASQMNRDIPTPDAVAGLRDFLSNTFRAPPV
jgi:hypothetical protein